MWISSIECWDLVALIYGYVMTLVSVGNEYGLWNFEQYLFNFLSNLFIQVKTKSFAVLWFWIFYRAPLSYLLFNAYEYGQLRKSIMNMSMKLFITLL